MSLLFSCSSLRGFSRSSCVGAHRALISAWWFSSVWDGVSQEMSPEDLKHATFYHKHNQKKLAYWEMSAPDRFR